MSLMVQGLLSLQAVLGSGLPQPQVPGAILLGSLGQPSTASQVPSPSVSTEVPAHTQLAPITSFTVQMKLSLQAVLGSGLKQPQVPGAILLGSVGQPSLQFGVPSPSVSVSATPQPQT